MTNNMKTEDKSELHENSSLKHNETLNTESLAQEPLTFDTAQQHYQNMTASPRLKQRVAFLLNQDAGDQLEPNSGLQLERNSGYQATSKKPFRRNIKGLQSAVMTSAAAIVICCLGFGLAVNMSPTFADTVAKVPGLSSLVQIFTLGRYEINDGGFQVAVETPQITGLLDKSLEARLNAEFSAYSQALIAGVEADIAALKAEYGPDEVHFGVNSGYQVVADTDRYVVLDVYLVNTVGSSTTFHKYYTIDKEGQQLLTLGGAIAHLSGVASPLEGVDLKNWLEKIEAHVLGEMRHQMDAGTTVYWLDDPGMMPSPLVTEEALFYLDSDGNLVIAFEEYSVAPGSEGTPRFVIPKAFFK